MSEPVPVTVQPSRVSMLAIASLGALVLILGLVLLLVLHNGQARDDKIGQLACQVERLGGQPLGAKCPPKPTRKPSPRVAVTPSPVPSRVVVTVRPRGAAASPRAVSPRRTTAPAPRPSPSRRPSPPPGPSPSPSPRCLLHDPLSGRCLT